ncbi:MAG: hypothetical protein HY066_00650 [Betaproteobacteria bacterium]|nr:hypothetical protein [Betaproteobacteria bacterium]
MTARKRRSHTAKFRAGVAFAALKGDKVLSGLARQCWILPLARFTAYYAPQPTSAEDPALMRRSAAVSCILSASSPAD